MSEYFFANQKQGDQGLLRDELKQILVMQPETVDQVIRLSPALRALKESLPRAEITLITSMAGSQVAPLLPWVDEVMVYPDAWQDINESSLLNLRKDMAFLERMRSQEFSLAMIFTDDSQSPFPAAYACYLAGIPYRAGLTNDSSASVFSHFLPPPAEACHPVDRNLKLLELLAIYDSNNRVELRIPEDVERRANELLIEQGVTQDTPYVVLAPGARDPSEQYDPRYFAAVAHLLAAQSELQLVIVGGSEDVERIQPVLQVAEENLYGNVHSVVGKAGIPELAAILRQAAVTISNRSSSMYLAEAWDCPMIVVYPGTEPIDSWKPRNSSTRLLCRPDSCSICSNTTCPYGMKCLEVRPEEVAVVALEMLADQTYEPVRHSVFDDYKSEILNH